MKVFDPSTSPKSILYVEESFNLDINKFIVENYQQIVKSFEEDFNINFLYLPYVLKDESYMEQLQYNHPTFDPAKLDEVDIHDIYQDLINGEGKTGIGCALLSYDDNKSEQSELFYQFDNVENLIAQFKYFAKASRKHSIDKTYQGSSMTHFLTSDKFSDSKEEDNYLKEDLENIIKRMIEKGALKTVYLAIESTIIRNMPISKIRISKDYRIFLIDHRSGTLPTEVEMTP
ncbi:MAG: hypothetical protein PHC34_11345 [Candidatus Gastranaerophilales bacterium]|nr:hypothetical protein [Candidatus Gastranaerophilales bacterium]